MVLDPIDLLVGDRVKMRRGAVGMTQGTLGEHLGITFQQIQKYENGSNRISSSRIQEMARVLGMPVAAFFGETPEPLLLPPVAQWAFLPKESRSLNEAFVKISNQTVRRGIIALLATLARL